MVKKGSYFYGAALNRMSGTRLPAAHFMVVDAGKQGTRSRTCHIKCLASVKNPSESTVISVLHTTFTRAWRYLHDKNYSGASQHRGLTCAIFAGRPGPVGVVS